VPLTLFKRNEDGSVTRLGQWPELGDESAYMADLITNEGYVGLDQSDIPADVYEEFSQLGNIAYAYGNDANEVVFSVEQDAAPTA
jgi:hypothetical protein